jgi:hypothetical protein
MSLKAELDAFRADFMAKVSPEIREAMARADMELIASGISQQALKAGDRVPDFWLPEARGNYVRLYDLLAKGPVVLSFYRGGWALLQSGTAGLAESAAPNCRPWREACRDLPTVSR